MFNLIKLQMIVCQHCIWWDANYPCFENDSVRVEVVVGRSRRRERPGLCPPCPQLSTDLS